MHSKNFCQEVLAVPPGTLIFKESQDKRRPAVPTGGAVLPNVLRRKAAGRGNGSQANASCMMDTKQQIL